MTQEEYKELLQQIRDSVDIKIPKFECENWLDRWLMQPLPAIGNKLPIYYINEPEGFETLQKIIGSMANGTYA